MIVKLEKAIVSDAYVNGDFSGALILAKDFHAKVYSQQVNLSELPEYEPLDLTMDVKIKPGKNGLSVGVLNIDAKRLAVASPTPAKGDK